MIVSGTSLTITLLSVALAGLVAYVVGQFLFRKDHEVEKRRKAAMQITSKLEAFGLKRVPRITGAYAIGDYSSLVQEIKSFAEAITGDEVTLLREFDDVFTNVLTAKLKTEAGRALVAAKLADAVKPSDPSITSSVSVSAVPVSVVPAAFA